MPFDLDTLNAVLPELLLVGTILLLLIARLLPGLRRIHAGWLAVVALVGVLTVCRGQWLGELPGRTLFSGMLIFDRMTVFFRLFLVGFALLSILLVLASKLVPVVDSADYCTLILGATVGMILLTSACHLLLVVLALEMASLPCYALAGWVRDDRKAGEAALKYAIYGAGAAGILLYGTSLLAGYYGTGSLPDLAAAIASTVHVEGSLPAMPLLGLLFILSGLAFKLAVVPFHFWCPDVFEGAAAEVVAFLSVASKAAAIAMLARLAFFLTGLDPLAIGVAPAAWQAMVRWVIPVLVIAAGLTCTFGNLAAYRQFNAQRMLAYSTIGQAGFLLMGVAALTRESLSAVLVYLVAFLFANLGAFAVLAFVRKELGGVEFRDLRGMIRRAPVMTVTFAFFILSLLGIPPLIGFFAKFNLFWAIYQSAGLHAADGMQGWLYGLLIVAVANTALAAVYYLGILRVMILEQRVEDLEGEAPKAIAEPRRVMLYAGLLTVVVAGLIVFAEPLVAASRAATDRYSLKARQ